MKKYLALALLACTHVQAHAPYVAPLAYMTDNTQITVLSAYAEQALQPEYALKDIQFSITQPDQAQLTAQPQPGLKSAAAFDLKLPEKGTYTVYAKTSHPLQYVQHNKQWKIFADVAADKAPALSERDFVIPSDFKGKLPKKVDTVREWSIQSYVSKGAASAVAVTPAPIQVSFQTHPNEIQAQRPVQLQLSKAGKPLAQAEVLIRAQGASEQQAQSAAVNADGTASVTFPQAGSYLLEVSEAIDPKTAPKNQHYTIISLGVTAPAS